MSFLFRAEKTDNNMTEERRTFRARQLCSSTLLQRGIFILFVKYFIHKFVFYLYEKQKNVSAQQDHYNNNNSNNNIRVEGEFDAEPLFRHQWRTYAFVAAEGSSNIEQDFPRPYLTSIRTQYNETWTSIGIIRFIINYFLI